MQARTARLLAVAGLAAAACKGGQSGEEVDLRLPHLDAEVPVTVTAPEGWVRSPHDRYGFLPSSHTGKPGVASWSLRVDCYGQCEAEAISGNVARAVAGEKRAATRAMKRAGESGPARIDVIVDKDIEGGKQLAYRVDYAGEPPASDRERVAVYCPHYRDGDDHFVVLEGTAPLADEDKYLDDFLAACESVRIGE